MGRIAGVSFILALAVACACGRGAGGGGGGSGGGPGTGGGGGSSADCEAARAHVTELYTADAADRDAKLRDQMIADNVAMVIAECTREPGRVAACAVRARSAPELEATCLSALDDDGTEGDRFKAR